MSPRILIGWAILWFTEEARRHPTRAQRARIAAVAANIKAREELRHIARSAPTRDVRLAAAEGLADRHPQEILKRLRA